MKHQAYLLNILLTAVLTVVLLTVTVLRALFPTIVIPELNIPNIVFISLVVLLFEHYIGGKTTPNYIFVALFAALAFGALPFAASAVMLKQAALLACIGGVVFTLTAWLFRSMQERLSSGPASKLAPIVSAIGLYLASQCFMGIIL